MILIPDIAIARQVADEALQRFQSQEDVPWMMEFSQILLGEVVTCPRCFLVQDRRSGNHYKCSCGVVFGTTNLFASLHPEKRESILDHYRSALTFSILHRTRRREKAQPESLQDGMLRIIYWLRERTSPDLVGLIDGFLRKQQLAVPPEEPLTHPGRAALLRAREVEDHLEKIGELLKVPVDQRSKRLIRLIAERDRMAKEVEGHT